VSATQVVRVASINPGFFETLGQHVLAGRDFDARDLRAGERPVVVNRSFVEKALDGRNPVGQRIRFVAAPDQAAQPWRPIIGVVNDLGMHAVDPRKGAGIYQVVAPGDMSSPHLLVRVAGDPAAFVPRLRAIVTDVEPSIVMSSPVPLKECFRRWSSRRS
jgi:MacB-like periplasmic core domain